MPGVVVRTLALALALVFAWAAGSKVLLWARWRSSLAVYDLGAFATFVALAVPFAELGVAALLLAAPMKAGAAAALALLGVFSLGLLRARTRRGDRLPCGCFGRTKERDYRVLLARNAALSVCAAGILLAGENARLSDGASLPAPDELIPALLVALGVATIVWIALGVAASIRKGSNS